MYNLFVWTDDGWELFGEFHQKSMMEHYRKQWEARGWVMEYTAF